MYNKLINEYINNPRDIHTVPISNQNHKWFHVFVKDSSLYIENAHNNSPSCNVKTRRLFEEECNTILDIYHRRMQGEKVSSEAQKCTYSQVYWYGIFFDLNL